MPDAVHPCPHCGKAVAQTDRACPHCHKGLSGRALLADTTPTSSSLGLVVCLAFGALIAVFGMLFHSEATRGVAFLTLACFLAICARIAQAGHQHKQMLKAIGLSREAR